MGGGTETGIAAVIQERGDEFLKKDSCCQDGYEEMDLEIVKKTN